MGAVEMNSLLGSCNQTSLASWTAIADLEAVYARTWPSCKTGRIQVAVMQLQPDMRFKLLSYINSALSERESTAFQVYGGQLTRASAYTWLLIRKLKDDTEVLIPGLRPETPRTGNATLIGLDRDAVGEFQSTTGRRLMGGERRV